jgi:hypothetical protein
MLRSSQYRDDDDYTVTGPIEGSDTINSRSDGLNPNQQFTSDIAHMPSVSYNVQGMMRREITTEQTDDPMGQASPLSDSFLGDTGSCAHPVQVIEALVSNGANVIQINHAAE